MALVICPRCDTLLKVHKTAENFFCPCGTELQHPAAQATAKPVYGVPNFFSRPSAYSSSTKSKDKVHGENSHQRRSDEQTEINFTERIAQNTSADVNQRHSSIRHSNSSGAEREANVRDERPRVNHSSSLPGSSSSRGTSETNSQKKTGMKRLQAFLPRRMTGAAGSGSDHSGSDGQDEVKTENIENNPELFCSICESKFGLIGHRRKVCRTCKSLVCGTCSKTRWPSQMLPKENNIKNEKLLRVCSNCHDRSERFRSSLLKGDLAVAQSTYESGITHLYFPYQIYPQKQFPIHCAVSSGNLDLVKWLVSKRCNPRVANSRGWTSVSIAADGGHQEIVKFLVFKGLGTVDDIQGTKALQRCLQTAFIELQQMTIQKNLQSYIANAGNEEKLPEPKSSMEEEEQLSLALKMSLSNNAVDKSEREDKHDEAKVEEPASECIVCFESAVDCVLVPCGHMSCCTSCGQQFKECPICRQAVTQVVKTFRT